MPRCLIAVLAFIATLSIGLWVSHSTCAQEPTPKPSPVVVELFTSQGCSSCPPADKLLVGLDEIAKKHGLPVYCLSFHVDYWNSLGWRDPYSAKQYTQRQRQYAAALKSNRVYTPQMIVNGETEFVGSRARDAQQAIESGLATQTSAKIDLEATISADGTNAEIDYRISGGQPQTLLNLALVQKQAKNEIPRGENAGRQLAHAQVVRAFQSLPPQSDSGTVRLTIPDGLRANEMGVVAYLQSQQSMQVLGASGVDF